MLKLNLGGLGWDSPAKPNYTAFWRAVNRDADQRSRERERARVRSARRRKDPHYRAVVLKAKHKYRAKQIGITLDEYRAVRTQRCSLCPESSGRIVADHDHKTGKFRGPLCDDCNKLVGRIELKGAGWLRQVLQWTKIDVA